MVAKKFCVVTTGRCGSGAFMRALSTHDDIAIPTKNTGVPCNEILHPLYLPEMYATYSLLCGQDVSTKPDLVTCFYRFNAVEPFSGFKLLFCQSIDFQQFFNRTDITFVVLLRHDVSSTMASQMLASDTGIWDGRGGKHTRSWSYSSKREAELKQRVTAHYRAVTRLKAIPDSILIYYEDISAEGFSDSHLTEFFGRDIRLQSPKMPTSGQQYVRNWDEFRYLADSMWAECCNTL